MRARLWVLLVAWQVGVALVVAVPAGAEQVVELWRGGGSFAPLSVSVNPVDQSCWVADNGHAQVVHLSATGAELWRSAGFPTYWQPYAVSVNPTDGSCWVADRTQGQVVHLAADGTELFRGGGFSTPTSVSVNAADGSCWVASGTQVVHLSASGAELWRGGSLSYPISVSVNRKDGSCWVADYASNQVVHLSAAGTEVWRGGGFLSPGSVSANPTDSSCWVADSYHYQVVHLSASGTELWRGSGFFGAGPTSVSVNGVDGSCWVASGTEVVHLSASGGELSRFGTFPEAPYAVSVNPTDGSCWVAERDINQIVHLGLVGAHFSASPLSGAPPLGVDFKNLSVDSPSGPATAWAWDFGDGGTSTEENPSHEYTARGKYTVSLTMTGPGGESVETKAGYIVMAFTDVSGEFWAVDAILACVKGGIVGGYPEGDYRPGVEVDRGQMAVFISRALAGGDSGVPSGPPVAYFPDVGTEHWAYKYVEYAYANNIVGGYPDGSYWPDIEVDRGQMAAFVARSIVTPTGEAGLASYTPPETPSFPDVGTGFWTYKHIEYLKEHLIVGGYPDGWYHPEVVCTRDQMAVYITRAFGLTP